MAYIGNQVSSVPFIIDTFSGTGSATVFGQLTRSPASVASIAVFVSGVYKTPGVDYTLNGDILIFGSAPALGTNNIIVHHVGNGSSTSVPSDGSVTGAKLASNVVRSNNIVAGSLTSNLIAVGAITGNLLGLNVINSNNIVDGAILGNDLGLNSISGNLLVTNTITGNLINVAAISGNQIGLGAISGNQIGLGAVSGNQIGTGAISANHFSGGGVTSETLSPNLSVSVSRTLETAVVSGSGASGTINLDVISSSVQYYDGTTSANVTFNVRGNSSYSFDSITSIGQTTSVAAIVKHTSGSGGRYVCFLTIDGGTPTIVYAANGKPGCTTTMIASTETNIFTWSILKIAGGTYRVFASNTIFGSA